MNKMEVARQAFRNAAKESKRQYPEWSKQQHKERMVEEMKYFHAQYGDSQELIDQTIKAALVEFERAWLDSEPASALN